METPTPFLGENSYSDSTQEDDEQENELPSADTTSTAEYTAYIGSTPLHAATTSSGVDAIRTPTLVINASFASADTTANAVHLTGAAIIIGVIVGVVVMMISVGLILSYRRRDKARESEEDLEGDERMSCCDSESADSYVLQNARTQSVEFKKGILISVPSRA